MGYIDRIEINPRVCNGKPVIKGTRIPVTVILDLIAECETREDLLAGYPELTVEDIKSALQYARSFIEHSDVEAVSA